MLIGQAQEESHVGKASKSRQGPAWSLGVRSGVPEFKTLVREQFFMLLLDEEASLAAIPRMLPHDVQQRRAVLRAIREVLSAGGEVSGGTTERLDRVARLFGVNQEVADERADSSGPQAKAS